jgi:DNA-binding CsgD family transcriptional regulator
LTTDAPAYDQWVAAWRGAVRSASAAVGLVELPSTELLELSPQAASWLGTERGTGMDFAVDKLDEARQIVDLLATGAIDNVVARRRLRSADGDIIDVIIYGRAVRSSGGPDLIVVELDEQALSGGAADANDAVVHLAQRFRGEEVTRPVVGALDSSWQLVHLTAGIEELLGHPVDDLMGTSIVEITHPDDLSALLFAFAEATFAGDAPLSIRLRRPDQSWQMVEAVVTATRKGDLADYTLVLAGAGEPAGTHRVDRVEELEQRLTRIAAEVAEAGLSWGIGPPADVVDERIVADLPPRQREVVSRLARGQRVPTIAREMYLSQSTVRNYLSAVFRKLGVGSQEELLTRLRRPAEEASG